MYRFCILFHPSARCSHGSFVCKLRCHSLGIPHLLRIASDTMRSAAMNTPQFGACTNVQTTFSGALSQLFFLMNCVIYMFQNKKVCQKIRNLQEFPLRNVFLSLVSGLGFFPQYFHRTFLHEFFQRSTEKFTFQKQSSPVKSHLFLSEIKHI